MHETVVASKMFVNVALNGLGESTEEIVVPDRSRTSKMRTDEKGLCVEKETCVCLWLPT